MAIKTISMPDELLKIANENAISLSKATQIGVRSIIENMKNPEGETIETLREQVKNLTEDLEKQKRRYEALKSTHEDDFKDLRAMQDELKKHGINVEWIRGAIVFSGV